MTRRDEILQSLQARLRSELGEELAQTSSELTEVVVVSGTIADTAITVTVTRFPRGENPETYQGAEQWSVGLTDENGEALDRYHNPETSLTLALETIDWHRIREGLRAG